MPRVENSSIAASGSSMKAPIERSTAQRSAAAPNPRRSEASVTAAIATFASAAWRRRIMVIATTMIMPNANALPTLAWPSTISLVRKVPMRSDTSGLAWEISALAVA